MNISFFNLRFDLFLIVAKEVNQIKNNVVCVVAGLCFRVLLCTHYWPLQCFSTYFRKLKEIGVLRAIFPDYVISCDYDVTKSFYKSLLNSAYLWGRTGLDINKQQKYFSLPDHLLAENLILIFGLCERTKKK